jgi:hypothetical protein
MFRIGIPREFAHRTWCQGSILHQSGRDGTRYTGFGLRHECGTRARVQFAGRQFPTVTQFLVTVVVQTGSTV